MLHWLRQLANRLSHSRKPNRLTRRKSLVRARPRVEGLEDRAVPAGLQFIECGSVRLLPMVQDDADIANVTARVCGALPRVNFSLDAGSDTGAAGDLRTEQAFVNLSGTTGANFRVRAAGSGQGTVADSLGRFTLQGVPLGQGPNEVSIQVFDQGGNPGQMTQTITRNIAPVVVRPNPTADPGAASFSLANVFTDADTINTIVRFDTIFGNIDVELFDINGIVGRPHGTPLTVANFLNYLNDRDFRDSIFHRLVPNFVLQGGGQQLKTDPIVRLDQIMHDPPVLNEPGISNLRGTVAMAKVGGDPDSATSEFFFNLANNSANLDNQNGGFTAFGRVLGDGMAVVDRFAALQPSARGQFMEIPLINYTGPGILFPLDAKRENFALVNDITVRRRPDTLAFTVIGNTNPALVTATVNADKIDLFYQDGQTGSAILTVRATDRDGAFVDTQVTVSR